MILKSNLIVLGIEMVTGVISTFSIHAASVNILRNRFHFSNQNPAARPTTGSIWRHHHHVASSPLEKLVTAADHFASAEREQGNFYTRDIHRLTRMEALLERVSLDANGKTRSTRYRLPLAPLSLNRRKIFFQNRRQNFHTAHGSRKDQHGDTWLSPTPLNA
jgi:hypothetical protein